jgi:hypothetical protein
MKKTIDLYFYPTNEDSVWASPKCPIPNAKDPDFFTKDPDAHSASVCDEALKALGVPRPKPGQIFHLKLSVDGLDVGTSKVEVTQSFKPFAAPNGKAKPKRKAARS